MPHPAKRDRPWFLISAMVLLALSAAWKPAWLMGPDGADLRATAHTMHLILGLLLAALAAFAAATALLYQERRGAGLLWAIGWGAAVGAQILIDEQLARVALEGLTFADAVRQHLFGHVLALLLGVGVWRAEIVGRWRFRAAR